MTSLKRGDCYEALFRIKKEKNKNIDDMLVLLGSSEIIPSEVLDFIENNSLRTLNDFLTIISRQKPFFNNICFNYKEDISVYVKALLSFLTHLRITMDKNPELREALNNLFDIKNICSSVSRNLITGDNDQEIISIAKNIKSVYMSLDYSEVENK